MYASREEEETLHEIKALFEIAQQRENTRSWQAILGDDSIRQLRFTGMQPNDGQNKFLLILSKS